MIDEEFMSTILQHECGEDLENAEFGVDEAIADDVENGQLGHEQNGKSIYKSTCDYTMIAPETENNSRENTFDYSGS